LTNPAPVNILLFATKQSARSAAVLNLRPVSLALAIGSVALIGAAHNARAEIIADLAAD
jgi:hypothetical protein